MGIVIRKNSGQVIHLKPKDAKPTAAPFSTSDREAKPIYSKDSEALVDEFVKALAIVLARRDHEAELKAG